MRHRVRGRHLGRTAEHRKALGRNLITALLEHGRIRTTDAKAREVRPLAEKVITLGKRGDLHARRQALRVVGDGPALERLFGPIAERFAERPGGYTRLIKAGRRLGDAAPLAYLELLDEAPRGVRGPADGEKRRSAAAKATSRSRSGEAPARRRAKAAAPREDEESGRKRRTKRAETSAGEEAAASGKKRRFSRRSSSEAAGAAADRAPKTKRKRRGGGEE